MTRGRVYTASHASGYRLELTVKHTPAAQGAAFQMQTQVQTAKPSAAASDTEPDAQQSNHCSHADRSPGQQRQHSDSQTHCAARAQHSLPLAGWPASGRLTSAVAEPPHPLNADLNHPAAPLWPAQASNSHPAAPGRSPAQASLKKANASRQPPPARQAMSQGSQHGVCSRREDEGATHGSACSGSGSRQAGAALQSSANPSGTVYFSHCLNERRHITESTTGFTCFACKQRCKGLLVSFCHSYFARQRWPAGSDVSCSAFIVLYRFAYLPRA